MTNRKITQLAELTSPNNGALLHIVDTTELLPANQNKKITVQNLIGSTSSPLTTKGDLYIYSTQNSRLPIGNNGEVLTANSSTFTGLEWTSLESQPYISINSTNTVPLTPGLDSISIGPNTQATEPNSISIGNNAISTAEGATQLGPGTNSSINTLQYTNVKIANNRVVTPLNIEAEASNNINAVNGSITPIDVSTTAVIVNPPLAPQPQDTFAIVDSKSNAAINNITIDFVTAGHNLHSSNIDNYVININRGAAFFLYINSTIGWIITNA